MLRLLASEQQADPAVHPTGEQLAAYHEGRLVPQAASELQDHLVACEDCRSLLKDLMSFPELAPPPGATPDFSPARIDAAWSKMKTKIFETAAEPGDAEIRRGPWMEPTPEARREKRAAPAFPMALAASFLLGCLGLSFWVHSLRQQVRELSQPQADVAIYDLFTADDPLRDGQVEATELEPYGAGPWTFILHFPELPAGRLGVRIFDASGTELWSREGLELSPDGTASLSIRRGFLPAGECRIAVRALADGQWRPVAEFQVRVHD